MIYENVNTLFKQARQKQGITQMDLAKQLGYTTGQFVSNWEHNKCSPPMGIWVGLTEKLSLTTIEVLVEATKDLKGVLGWSHD